MGLPPGVGFKAGPTQVPVWVTDCGQDPCLTLAPSRSRVGAHGPLRTQGPLSWRLEQPALVMSAASQ